MYIDWMFYYNFFVIQMYFCIFVHKNIRYYWYIKEIIE